MRPRKGTASDKGPWVRQTLGLKGSLKGFLFGFFLRVQGSFTLRILLRVPLRARLRVPVGLLSGFVRGL